jgi:hypothetical protein
MTESIVLLERGSAHVPNFKSFLVTEAERKHVRQCARFQEHQDTELSSSFYFLQGKAPEDIHAIPNDFLSRMVTMDETWLYHYDPETRQQSVQWWHSGLRRPKKFRVQKSAGRFLASFFWDQDGIIPIDYLPNGQTSNAEYCSSLPVLLKDKHRAREGQQRSLLLHDNAPAYRAPLTQKKLAYLGFQCFDHPPDLASSDYHLFT